MGKYDSIRDNDRWNDDSKSPFLEAIANELAEMNRLKRIEIFYNHSQHIHELKKHGLAITEDLWDKA